MTGLTRLRAVPPWPSWRCSCRLLLPRPGRAASRRRRTRRRASRRYEAAARQGRDRLGGDQQALSHRAHHAQGRPARTVYQLPGRRPEGRRSSGCAAKGVHVTPAQSRTEARNRHTLGHRTRATSSAVIVVVHRRIAGVVFLLIRRPPQRTPTEPVPPAGAAGASRSARAAPLSRAACGEARGGARWRPRAGRATAAATSARAARPCRARSSP